MTASLAHKQAELDAARRHTAMLTAALAAGKHDCWCGAFGCNRFPGRERWYCGAHTRRDAAGLTWPVEAEAQEEKAA